VSDRQKPHHAYIECVRGYAIMLVITCHTTYLFPQLPYPVHRLTVLGWHGVQLFYLASAVTLMMSWHYEKARNGAVDVGAFFLRRFFRIAPAYYLASILYLWLAPPVGGFDPLQAAGTYLFVNAWRPGLMGVLPNGWSVVPGSWSIGVEFTFYVAFPFLASTITSLPRSICLVVAAVVLGAMLNSWFLESLQTQLGALPADKFLYFWFPNQMSVFALGICLFYLLEWSRDRPFVLALDPDLIAACALAGMASTAFITLPHWLTLRTPLPPTFLLVSLTFVIFVLALARSRQECFLNRPAALMGRVSFSAYLLHVAVLQVASDRPFLQNYFHSSGVAAVAAFGLTLIGVVLIVLAASWCSYRLIETPMIDLGKALIRRRRRPVVQSVVCTGRSTPLPWPEGHALSPGVTARRACETRKGRPPPKTCCPALQTDCFPSD
jgi:peptidoglycan/LPS O-acetylase OafA/YrhL